MAAVFPTPFEPWFRLINGDKLNRLFANPQFSSQSSMVALASGGITGATPVAATISNFSTVANNNDSAVLPVAKAGAVYLVSNNGAHALQMFGNGTDTIDGTAGATGISMPAGQDLIFVCCALGQWDSYGAGDVGEFTSVILAGSTSGTATLLAKAIAGTTTSTLPAVTGTLASTSGTDLFINDIYVTSGAQTANANVVPAQVPGLSGAVVVGTYRFRAYLPSAVASGTGGIAYQSLLTTAVLGTMQCSGLGYTAAAVAVQNTTTATSAATLFSEAAVVIATMLEGTFTVTTAGTFGITMCQAVSNASNSIAIVGGYLELSRIA